MVDFKLLRAYRDTAFIISTGSREISLRVGERNRELDDLLKEHRAKSCAFVTAWNPGSIKLPDGENARRQNALIAEARRLGSALLRGRGVGLDGKWPAEDSVLIIGIDRTGAVEIGKLFGQLCIVYAERESPVELVMCQK